MRPLWTLSQTITYHFLYIFKYVHIFSVLLLLLNMLYFENLHKFLVQTFFSANFEDSINRLFISKKAFRGLEVRFKEVKRKEGGDGVRSWAKMKEIWQQHHR